MGRAVGALSGHECSGARAAPAGILTYSRTPGAATRVPTAIVRKMANRATKSPGNFGQVGARTSRLAAVSCVQCQAGFVEKMLGLTPCGHRPSAYRLRLASCEPVIAAPHSSRSEFWSDLQALLLQEQSSSICVAGSRRVSRGSAFRTVPLGAWSDPQRSDPCSSCVWSGQTVPITCSCGPPKRTVRTVVRWL